MALPSLSSLLQDSGHAVWRADALAAASSTHDVALPSGHALLDAQLPGGGWPVGALCEILQAESGQHEWRLLLPVLSRLKQTVVLLGSPYTPFGPGLAGQGLSVHQLLWVKADALPDRMWAAEQLLRCAAVDALLLWLPRGRADHLRRLHLAAQVHAKLLFVMRPAQAQFESSPAVLRLLVGSAHDARQADGLLSVDILKRRGPLLTQTLRLRARCASLSVLLECAHALDRLAAPA